MTMVDLKEKADWINQRFKIKHGTEHDFEEDAEKEAVVTGMHWARIDVEAMNADIALAGGF